MMVKSMAHRHNIPEQIEIRGARVHNLKNVNVDIPLHQIVGIAGVSGSGKSSLALGVLYAEGSRRYLESLSTYTRRRMTQSAKAQVDDVRYVPAALALHQRPGVPGIRSTFGTMTELLNSLRLMFSRLSVYKCPNGHDVPPTLDHAAEKPVYCPICGEAVPTIGAEELAFNSSGACARCGGTGTVRTVDRSTLIPDEGLTIDGGAVASWNSLMWSLMTDVCRAMGVRTDIPFRDLTNEEKAIVYDGPMVKKHIFYRPKNAENVTAGEMDFTYYSATATVLNALNKVKDEKGMKRVEKFLKEDVCPECGGTRLSPRARALKLRGMSLDEVCTLTLSELIGWVNGVPVSLPEPMRPMAVSICEAFRHTAKRLVDLGLSYLSLDRAAATLSTGERQRTQLARAVRNRTTGVLYVLDEPSIGLHPCNLEGLTGVMDDLVADGNSVVLVDHDTQVLSHADWLIELGPEAGAGGGHIIAQVKLIDATPIGINVRSTVATYANVHDELRKAYAGTRDAKSKGFKASDFSYNTGSLRCPTCDGTGSISLDVQFLPDVDVPCPDCGGARYGKDAWSVVRSRRDGHGVSLPTLMAYSVDEALSECDDLKTVKGRLQVLHDLGLGYLTLGEATPGLSGGEAQRLKLASEMGRGQSDTVFVFDEPTIGLHPLDVQTLMAVFQHLVDQGATVIVIEHDLDVIRSADYIVDMGPGGGVDGGEIVATGTPENIKGNPRSVTGRYL